MIRWNTPREKSFFFFFFPGRYFKFEDLKDEVWNELEYVLLLNEPSLIYEYPLRKNVNNCIQLTTLWFKHHSCNGSNYLPLERIMEVFISKIGASQTTQLLLLFSSQLKAGMFSQRYWLWFENESSYSTSIVYFQFNVNEIYFFVDFTTNWSMKGS